MRAIATLVSLGLFLFPLSCCKFLCKPRDELNSKVYAARVHKILLDITSVFAQFSEDQNYFVSLIPMGTKGLDSLPQERSVVLQLTGEGDSQFEVKPFPPGQDELSAEVFFVLRDYGIEKAVAFVDSSDTATINGLIGLDTHFEPDGLMLPCCKFWKMNGIDKGTGQPIEPHCFWWEQVPISQWHLGCLVPYWWKPPPEQRDDPWESTHPEPIFK